MIDVALLLIVVGAGVLGWRRGLAVSLAAGLVFTAAGLPLAALAAGIGRPAPALAFVIGGLLGLVPLALRIDALTERINELVKSDALRIVDRIGGAVVNTIVAATIGWFVAALASIAPGDSPTLSVVRSSAVFGALVDAVPPQGALGVVVLRSGLVPSLNGPLVLAEIPDPMSAMKPAVLAARSSVLQVRSTACGRIVTGTGWVAGPGIVVTNAHVVAGTRGTFLSGGPQYAGAAATVTAFDPINDIAVLVLDAGQSAQLPPALRIVQRVQHGEPAAVIGYPLGGRQTAVSARIDRVAQFDVEALTGGAPTPVNILAFRAKVRPGNSGGPVVAEDGSVLGLVVAQALGQRTEAAYGVPSVDLLKAIAQGSSRVPAATGRCLEESELTTKRSAREAQRGAGLRIR